MSKSIQIVKYTDRLHQAVEAVMRPESFATGANRRRNGRNTFSDRRGNYGAGAEEPETVLCKVTGQSGIGYSVDFYANGRESPSTGSGVLFATELALVGTLPEGSWILGHKTAVQITGGGES